MHNYAQLCIQGMINYYCDVDYPACLRYAKGCYMYDRYEECTSWCDHICQYASNETVLNNAKLLKGKSLYRSCEEKLRFFLKMKFTVSPEHELPKLTNEHLAKVKESILLLGRAHDNNFLDDDGSKFLDWAMIDYIREQNKLDSCKRCLLCRRKTVLKRSHVYPRSVLRVIAKPNVSEGEHRVYLHELKGKLSAKSAGEITYWMLCGTCEERLSQNGENEFCKEFFSPIFQASQQLSVKKEHAPAQSITHIDIKYGQWLYNFCVGILFRGLAVSVMPHCRNREEIYSVFLNFRKYILSLPVKVKEAIQKDVPESKKASTSTLESGAHHIPLPLMDPRMSYTPMMILVNPTSLNEGKPFLPATLLYSNIAALASIKLDDGQPTFTLDAPFLLVRLGLVNILVEFQGKNDATLYKKYSIKPEGGTYPVPSEDERWNNIPGGLWEVFQKEADDNQAANIEYFLKLASDQHLLKYGHDVSESSHSADDVQIEESLLELLSTDMGQDSAALIPRLDPHIEAKLPQEQNLSIQQFFSSGTQMNLLPKGFSFFDQMGCLTYSSVILPENHHILLHATDPDIGITVFLCTGAGAKFSPDCPYLIIMLSQGEITVIEGVTLTRCGCIAGFVSDFGRRSGTAHPIRLQAMPSIQTAVEVILPNILAENGFENLEAVIHWTNCHWYVVLNKFMQSTLMLV